MASKGSAAGSKGGGGSKSGASGNGHWVAGAIKNPGGLHKNLGISKSKTIPKSTLRAAAKRTGKVGKEARLAITMEGFHHGGGREMGMNLNPAPGYRGK
ncbi:MAG: hypothetical protein KGJ86_00260 [Chloroflexota bacterium]|nr:hypothetical protein [Chloroflexota bacterium]